MFCFRGEEYKPVAFHKLKISNPFVQGCSSPCLSPSSAQPNIGTKRVPGRLPRDGTWVEKPLGVGKITWTSKWSVRLGVSSFGFLHFLGSYKLTYMNRLTVVGKLNHSHHGRSDAKRNWTKMKEKHQESARIRVHPNIVVYGSKPQSGRYKRYENISMLAFPKKDLTVVNLH